MLKIYYLRIYDFQHLSEDELFPLVGEDTVRKVTGYKNPGVRRTKLLGEGMIRRLLFRLWGLHKEDYLIRIGEHGKPLVESRFFGLDIIYRIPVIISWRLFRISKSESISSKKGKPAWKWPGVFSILQKFSACKILPEMRRMNCFSVIGP